MYQFPLKAHRVLVGGSCNTDIAPLFCTGYPNPDPSVRHEKGDKKPANHEKTADPNNGYPGVPVYLKPCVEFAFQAFQGKSVRLKGRRIQHWRLEHWFWKSVLKRFPVLKYPEASLLSLLGPDRDQGSRAHHSSEVRFHIKHLKLAFIAGQRKGVPLLRPPCL